MLTSLIKCHGCSRSFTPRGLSQHVSKTHDPRCQKALAVSQAPAAPSSIKTAITPRLLDPNNASYGAEYGQADVAPISDGATTATRVTRYLCTITDEEHNLDGVLVAPPDPADVADADDWEELNAIAPVMVDATPEDITDQGGVSDEPPTPDDLTDHVGQPEVSNQDDTAAPESATASPVVVERFPFGCPGAPIPDINHGSEVQQTAFTNLAWAPFQSQLDWDIAQWAKMCGRSSSAVSDLLAIPGVCTDNIFDAIALIYLCR
jgi:hypothetical protein